MRASRVMLAAGLVLLAACNDSSTGPTSGSPAGPGGAAPSGQPAAPGAPGAPSNSPGAPGAAPMPGSNDCIPIPALRVDLPGGGKCSANP